MTEINPAYKITYNSIADMAKQGAKSGVGIESKVQNNNSAMSKDQAEAAKRKAEEYANKAKKDQGIGNKIDYLA